MVVTIVQPGGGSSPGSHENDLCGGGHDEGCTLAPGASGSPLPWWLVAGAAGLAARLRLQRSRR